MRRPRVLVDLESLSFLSMSSNASFFRASAAKSGMSMEKRSLSYLFFSSFIPLPKIGGRVRVSHRLLNLES